MVQIGLLLLLSEATFRQSPRLDFVLERFINCPRIQQQNVPFFYSSPFGPSAYSVQRVTEGSKQSQRWTISIYEHQYVMYCKCERQKAPTDSLLGMNISELLNIQKRDCPSFGPSYKNSWPNPLPHLPQQTWEIYNQNIWIKTLWMMILPTSSSAVCRGGLPLWVPRLQGVWKHCPHGWSLRRPAKGRSAQTLMCWKTTRGHILSTRTYLRRHNSKCLHN